MCCCMQLATLHNDGKEASASEAVLQQALKMTYERLVSPYDKVFYSVYVCDLSHFENLLMYNCNVTCSYVSMSYN